MHHKNISWIQKGQTTHERNSRCVVKSYPSESGNVIGKSGHCGYGIGKT